MTAIAIVGGWMLIVVVVLWWANRTAERTFVDRIAELNKRLTAAKEEEAALIAEVKRKFEAEIVALKSRVAQLESEHKG